MNKISLWLIKFIFEKKKQQQQKSPNTFEGTQKCTTASLFWFWKWEKPRISMWVLSQRLVSHRCIISALHQSNTRVSPQHQKQLIPTRTSLLLWETCHPQLKVVLIMITVIQELTFYKNKSCYNIRHFVIVPCGKKQTLVAIRTLESGPAKDRGHSSGSSMKIKCTPLNIRFQTRHWTAITQTLNWYERLTV